MLSEDQSGWRTAQLVGYWCGPDERKWGWDQGDGSGDGEVWKDLRDFQRQNWQV